MLHLKALFLYIFLFYRDFNRLTLYTIQKKKRLTIDSTYNAIILIIVLTNLI